MVKLIFYGGVNEIGGNKILLEDKGTKIFLDFGQSFTFGAEYFTSWLQPRCLNGLGDYFESNLLPKEIAKKLDRFKVTRHQNKLTNSEDEQRLEKVVWRASC
jgi:hypothetical protein